MELTHLYKINFFLLNIRLNMILVPTKLRVFTFCPYNILLVILVLSIILQFVKRVHILKLFTKNRYF